MKKFRNVFDDWWPDPMMALGMLGGKKAIVPTPVISPLISDIFTDANGTNINAHTIAPINIPATAWTNLVNAFTIQENQLAPTADGAFDISVCDPGIADGIFAVSVNDANKTNQAGISFRCKDKDNYIFLSRVSFGGNQSLVFFTNTGGSFVAIADVNCDWIDGSELAVITNGASLIGYVNAIPMISTTSSFNQTETKSGPIAVRTSHRLDNYLASTVVGMPKGALVNYVFCGDSLTKGTAGGVQLPYPNQMLLNLHAHPIQSARGTNLGEVGRRASAIEANQGAAADALYDAAYAKNICVVWIGTNDIADGVAAATTLGYISDFCNARKTAGFKVIVCNIIKQVGITAGAKETARTDLNAALASGYSSFAHGYVDLAANAAFSNPADATYYQSDQVHLTTMGDTVAAGLVSSAIQSL